MIRLYVLVEGQTEEEFIESILEPHLRERQIWVHRLVVETSRDAFGRKRRGGGHWSKWLRDLKRLKLSKDPSRSPGTARDRTRPAAEGVSAVRCLGEQAGTDWRAAALTPTIHRGSMICCSSDRCSAYPARPLARACFAKATISRRTSSGVDTAWEKPSRIGRGPAAVVADISKP